MAYLAVDVHMRLAWHCFESSRRNGQWFSCEQNARKFVIWVTGKSCVSLIRGNIFYYYKPTGDSQWAAPKAYSEKFACTWRDCREQFDSLMELEAHRRDCHWWHCDACFERNYVDVFPQCASCQNVFSGTGKTNARAYERDWETKLVMEEKVVDPLNLDLQGKPRMKTLAYNTLTDLRPMSAADSQFLDIRQQVLDELASRPQTVAQRQKAHHEAMWPRARTTRIKLTGEQRRKLREIERVTGAKVGVFFL